MILFNGLEKTAVKVIHMGAVETGFQTSIVTLPIICFPGFAKIWPAIGQEFRILWATSPRLVGPVS